MCKCMLSHFSHVHLFEICTCTCTVHRTTVHQAPLPMEFSRLATCLSLVKPLSTFWKFRF